MKDHLLNELVDSIGNMTDIENRIYEYVNRLDDVNNYIKDILHYIENHDLSKAGKIALMDKLTELRKERRDIKQMWQIYNSYGNNRNKLVQKDHREFLVHELKKTDKDLQTEYRYRIFTLEELDELNKEKRGPGRPRKVVPAYNNSETNHIIEEE